MTTESAVAAPAQDAAGGTIDVDRWRERIRAETFGGYHYHMGVALEASGDADRALAAFRRGVETCGWLHQAHLRLRDLLDRTGRKDEAAAVHARALELDAAYERRARLALVDEALDRQEPGEAHALLKRLEEEGPARPDDDFPGRFLAVGRGLHSHLQMEEAADAYRAALRHAPDALPGALEAHRFLVLAEQKAGAVDKALEHARALFRSLPDDVATYDSLIWTMLINGQHRAALEISEQAVRRWPDRGYFLAYAGAAHMLQGDLDAAMDRMRQAATVDEHCVALPFLALAHLTAGKAEEAVRIGAEGARQAPERPFNRAVHSICLFAAGRTDEALAEAEKAIASPAQLMLSHFAHAQALLARGRRPEAEAALRKGLALEPGTLGYYTALVRWPSEIMALVAASGASDAR